MQDEPNADLLKLCCSFWLGIPADEFPPNHYRLLALDPFESDPGKIDQAAQSVVSEVEKHREGEYAEAAARLLVHVHNARNCLLDPASKQSYDETLRKRLSGFGVGNASSAPSAVAAAPRAAPPVRGKPAGAAPAVAPHAMRPVVWMAVAAGLGVLAVLLLVGVITLMLGRDEEKKSAENDREAKTTETQPTDDDIDVQTGPTDVPSMPDAAPPSATPGDDSETPNATDSAHPEDEPQQPPADQPDPKDSVLVPLDPPDTPDTPAAAPTNPFDRLLTEIELPSRDAVTAKASGLAVDLGPLPQSCVEDLKLSLDSGACDGAGLYDFRIDPIRKDGVHQWNVMVAKKEAGPGEVRAAIGDEGLEFEKPVAFLTIDAGYHLRFEWNDELLYSQGRQLANGIVELAYEDFYHTLQLRAAGRHPAYRLDLRDERSFVPVTLGELPPEEKVFLELTSLDDFNNQSLVVEPESKRIEVGGRGKVVIGEQEQAEVRIAFEQDSDGFKVQFEPMCEIGSRTHSLAASHVIQEQKNMTEKLFEAHAELAKARGKVVAINSELEVLIAQFPRTTGTRRVKLNARIKDLQEEAKKQRSIITRSETLTANVTEPLQQSMLAAALGHALHGKAQIGYRIVAETGGTLLVLFTTEPSSDAVGIAPIFGDVVVDGGPVGRFINQNKSWVYDVLADGSFGVRSLLDGKTLARGEWLEAQKQVRLRSLTGNSEVYRIAGLMELVGPNGTLLRIPTFRE